MNTTCLQIITRLSKGGAEEAVLELVRNMAKQDIHCDIAVGEVYNHELLEKFPLPKGCKVHHVPSLVRNPNPLKDGMAYRDLKTLMQEKKYRIVNTHTAKAGILGRFAARAAKVPGIFHTVHGLSFGSVFFPPMRFLYQCLEQHVGRFTRFIFVAESLKKKYIEARVATEEQSSVIYVGTELGLFRKVSSVPPSERTRIRKDLGIDRDALVLACIGRVTPTKRQDVLIELFAQFLKDTSKNVVLALLGETDARYQKKLEHLCKKLQVESSVLFCGYRKELWNVLPAIDIHCFTSVHEGLPLVLVQTAAAGIVNVCFRCSGVEEIIDHGKSGFVFDYANSRGFVSALRTLAHDTTLRKSMGQSAQKKSYGSSNYSWDLAEYAQRTTELYAPYLS